MRNGPPEGMQNRTLAFEDEHITIELLDFNSHTGVVQVIVREKHERVGFYYIWVNFKSGDSSQIDYDGGNPNREQALTIRTTHRDDNIKEMIVKRVRD